jgi:hypothetical protein
MFVPPRPCLRSDRRWSTRSGNDVDPTPRRITTDPVAAQQQRIEPGAQQAWVRDPNQACTPMPTPATPGHAVWQGRDRYVTSDYSSN